MCSSDLPGRNQYTLHSLLPKSPPNLAWGLVRVACTAFEGYSMAKCIAETGFIVFTGLAYLSLNSAWLQAPNRDRTLALYRPLRILNTMYNHAIAPWIYPTYKCALESLALFAGAAAFKTPWTVDSWHVQTFFTLVGLFTTAQAIGGIWALAGVPALSAAALKRGMHGGQRGGAWREVRICRVMYCCVGSLFYVEQSDRKSVV